MVRLEGPDIKIRETKQWIAAECLAGNAELEAWRIREDAEDCECHYQAPYGFVIMAGCRWHD